MKRPAGAAGPSPFEGRRRGGHLRVTVRDMPPLLSFPNTDMPSRPRSASRPSYAGSPHPSIERGRREDREPAGHPRSAVRMAQETGCTAAYRCSRDIPAFPAQWFDGLCPALLGERCTIAPVALRMADDLSRSGRGRHREGLTHSIRASGPHDFAVRRSHRSFARRSSSRLGRPARPDPHR